MDRVHRPVRGRRAGLRDPGRGRRAAAAHLLPGARAASPPRWGYDNQVIGWTPDGSVDPVPLAARRGRRALGGPRSTPCRAEGGLAKALPMPTSGAGDFSPDGKRLAYSPLFRDFRTWKRYEGGWAQDLYIYDLATNDAKPFATSVRTERDPMWIGDADLLRLRPRRHAQPLRVRPRDRGGHASSRSSTTWDVRWPSSDNVVAHRLRAGRRAARLRRARRRPTRRSRSSCPNDGVAMRPARVSRREERSRTSSSARRASGRCSWPAATSSRCRSRRARRAT